MFDPYGPYFAAAVASMWKRNPKLFRRLRKVSLKIGKSMLEIAQEGHFQLLHDQEAMARFRQEQDDADRLRFTIFPCGVDPLLKKEE